MKLSKRLITLALALVMMCGMLAVAASADYFKVTPYKGVSIVDGLAAIGENWSFAYRTKIAHANGIEYYYGGALQNKYLLDLLKDNDNANGDGISSLKKPEAAPAPAPAVAKDGCYKAAYKGGSIVDALASIKVNWSFKHRAEIAAANGIENYKGTYAQNAKLVELLKAGDLKKAASDL